MDRFKFTTIAHGDHRLCSPLSNAKLGLVMSVLKLDATSRVLDVACGKGEMLVRMAESYGVSGVGVDHSSAFVADARKRADACGVADRIEWVEQEASTYAPEPGSFDVACCLGARPYGSYSDTLVRMGSFVTSGGLLVVGEGYWRQEPEATYLKFLGASKGDYADHAGTAAVGISLGLTLIYSTTSSVDEFDHYEGKYLAAMERYLRENPEDPDADAMAARIRGWRDAYLRFGRETLGFGVYVFMKR